MLLLCVKLFKIFHDSWNKMQISFLACSAFNVLNTWSFPKLLAVYTYAIPSSWRALPPLLSPDLS